jgi:HAD superfamily hydrolase (TIGR01549 family)
VSFDIFDTAVIRSVVKPTDVFNLVEQQFEAYGNELRFDYKTARIESERRAREKAWRINKCTETTLDEIYLCMREDFNIDHGSAENLKQSEINTEIKICAQNQFIHELYNYSLEKGKEVIFMSDMYLPLDIVEQILKNTGYRKFHMIFLSSSLGITKSTGELYTHVLNTLRCKPQEVLHIGDNYDTDIKIPEKFGITTYFYEKNLERALSCKDIRNNLLNEFISRETTIEESVYLATIINQSCSRRGEKKKTFEYDFWYDFGYHYVGILFFAFTNWLLEQVRKDTIEKLYFLSRDGYILRKVYDFMSQSFDHPPRSEYVYASRRALNLPAIVELDDTTLDFLVSGTSTLRVAQFLERIGFNPSHFTKAIAEAGYSDGDDLVINGKDYANLRRLFTLLSRDIRDKAAIERTNLFAYFDSIGLLEEKKIGVVDIGWHGTLQFSMNKLLQIFGKDPSIKGYYLGTFHKAKDLYEAGQHMSAYLCEFGQPEDFHKIIKYCVEIFEFIHIAPHGSVINFERVNGTIKPIFDQDDQESEKIAKAQTVQKGALDFIDDLAKIWKQFNFLRFSKKTAVKPLARVLRNPTATEATLFGDLEHAEGFGNVYVKRYIAKPPKWSTLLTKPYSLFQGYHKAFWRKGYKKRFFSFNRPFRDN